MQENKGKGVSLCMERKKKKKRQIVEKGKVEDDGREEVEFRHEFQ